MSFEQPTPPGGAPLPPGGPAPAPAYRQDEFVRQPTSQTRPLQLSVGLYLIVSTILAFVVFFAVQHELRQVLHQQLAKSLATSSARSYTSGEIDTMTDTSMTVGLVVSALFGLVAIALGVVTLLRRAKWLLVVDMVLTGFGIIGLISGLANLASPNKVATQAAFGVLESLVSTGLFLWLLVTWIRVGPWAEEKVPALL